MNPDTKRFLTNQMMWIGISLAISLAISFILPFPISMVAIVGVFLGINYYMRRRAAGMMMGGRGVGGFGNMFGSSGPKYQCLSCGHRHSGGTCPRCGSKMSKAEFDG